MSVMKSTGLVKDNAELKKLIAENPDLPLVVMVGREAACDEFSYTYCSDVSCCIGEILDVSVPWTDYIYTDRDDFNESLLEFLCCCKGYEKLSDEEFNKMFEKEKSEYEPYWHKVILITGNN